MWSWYANETKSERRRGGTTQKKKRSMVGDIGSRNTILYQLSNRWTMYWYLSTLETFRVIYLGFFWICDIAKKKFKKSFNVLFTQKEKTTTLTYHSKR